MHDASGEVDRGAARTSSMDRAVRWGPYQGLGALNDSLIGVCFRFTKIISIKDESQDNLKKASSGADKDE